jgi:hypothetical protein
MTELAVLTDKQAVVAANFAVREWMKGAGPEALAIWQKIDTVSKTEGPLDHWLLDPSTEDPRAADLSRKVLEAFLDVADPQGPDFRSWVKQGIDIATGARAHFADPISAAIVGTLAIGLVLAARLKSIGPGGVLFYRGLPTNLSKVIQLAQKSFGLF